MLLIFLNCWNSWNVEHLSPIMKYPEPERIDVPVHQTGSYGAEAKIPRIRKLSCSDPDPGGTFGVFENFECWPDRQICNFLCRSRPVALYNLERIYEGLVMGYLQCVPFKLWMLSTYYVTVIFLFFVNPNQYKLPGVMLNSVNFTDVLFRPRSWNPKISTSLTSRLSPTIAITRPDFLSNYTN
jgi:hypothetical protein